MYQWIFRGDIQKLSKSHLHSQCKFPILFLTIHTLTRVLMLLWIRTFLCHHQYLAAIGRILLFPGCEELAESVCTVTFKAKAIAHMGNKLSAVLKFTGS